VLREAFLRTWPKFVLPPVPGRLKVYATLAAGAGSGYRWAWVQPLSLLSVSRSAQPTGVVFELYPSSGTYVAAFLVHSRASALFGAERVWDPCSSSASELGGAVGDVCSVSLGGYSGEIITHRLGGTKFSRYIRALCSRFGEPYMVQYYPGGRVVFTVNGQQHGEAELDEGPMLERHSADAVLVFGVAQANDKTHVTLRPV
jgi:hypothetical protein